MIFVRCMGLVGWVAASVGLLLGCGSKSPSGPSSDQHGALADEGGSPTANQPDARAWVTGTVVRDDTPFANDATVAYGMTMTMTNFTVPAGAEVYKCQDFGNPFGGGAVDIRHWKIAMTPGSHHMTLFNSPGVADGSLIECPYGGIMAGEYSIGSQQQNADDLFPDGVGWAIPAGMGFTMDAHYINAGTTPLVGTVSVSAGVAAPGVVTQHAGAIQLILLSIDVPPSTQPVTVGGTCTMPQDMNVYAVSPHMHYRASHFVATTGSKMLLTTDQWEDPQSALFLPPLQLKAGDAVNWSCNYTNETDQPLVYGASATQNVMCNTVIAFYPIQDLNNPLLTCQQ